MANRDLRRKTTTVNVNDDCQFLQLIFATRGIFAESEDQTVLPASTKKIFWEDNFVRVRRQANTSFYREKPVEQLTRKPGRG